MAKFLNNIQVFNIVEAKEELKSKDLTITQDASINRDLSIGRNLAVTGNLTISGTTTTINTATMTVSDPVITLGGTSAPTVNDKKDRGIEYRWHNGSSAKLGFFGFDESEGKLTFIPDATNTNETFTGTIGTIKANLDGEASSVTNGVYTTGSYTDPTWLTITKSKVGLTNVEDTALSTWKGSSNITTLGTITTGTWSGTTIAVNKGGTGATTFTANAILVGNGTSAISAPGPKLTTSALTFTGVGSISSATDKAITIDSGGTGAVNIGTGSGAKVITIGSTTSSAVKILKLNSAGFVKSSADGTLSVDTTAYTTNKGTVTSVGLSVPTGLTITGTPITTSGTLAITLTSGYSIPTTANQTNWSSAYTATNSATDANTASTLVKRSASGDIKVGKINELTLTKQNTGFTIAGGTTSKILTVTENVTIAHSTHASGSDNQTITSGNGMDFTTGSGNVTITLGTPSDVTTSSGNTVSSKTHTHKLVLPSTMPPSSHTHGKITNAGKIGTAGNLLVYTGSDGELNALTTGSNNQILKLVSGVPTWSAGYSLPTASASTLGGVKIGSGVTITSGVISVSTNYQAPLGKPASGSTQDILNGSTIRSLKQGTNVTITESGNIITITAKDTTYNNFIASGTTAKAGLVPAPSTTAGATKYLREDGTWVVPPDTKTNYYPTAFAWTNGSSAGPTGSLSGSGMSAVSFGAIPSASSSISGIVTTGAQTLAGAKTFSSQANFSIAKGTSPFKVTSDTVVTNLNADKLDGKDASDFSLSGHTHGSYNGPSSALTGANVFSNLSVTNGILTGVTTRALTLANLGYIGETTTGEASKLVKTGSDGSVTAGNKFNLGAQASMLYNATSKTIDFVFA